MNIIDLRKGQVVNVVLSEKNILTEAFGFGKFEAFVVTDPFRAEATLGNELVKVTEGEVLVVLLDLNSGCAFVLSDTDPEFSGTIEIVEEE